MSPLTRARVAQTRKTRKQAAIALVAAVDGPCVLRRGAFKVEAGMDARLLASRGAEELDVFCVDTIWRQARVRQ